MINIGTYDDPNFEKEMWPIIIDIIKRCNHIDGKMMLKYLGNDYISSTILNFPSSEPLMTKDELKANNLSNNYKINRHFFECLKESGKTLKPDIKAVMTLIYAQALITRVSINQIKELKKNNGCGVVLHIDKNCKKYSILNNKYYSLNKVPELVCIDCEIKPMCYYESIFSSELIPHN
jgi:hypothetical protein